jgi:uncharacterized lipoprotein YmbA
MGHARPSRRMLLIRATTLLALAACADTPPPRVYTLAERPPAVATNTPGDAAVVVRSALLPKYLDRPQIVRYAGAYQLELNEMERWAEPLRDMVTRVLVQNLAARMNGTPVFAESSPAAAAAVTMVAVEISRFDAGPDGTVVLAARWVTRSNGSAKNGSNHAARFAAKPASPSVDALVASMSDALGQLSDAIAGSLPAT